MDLVNNMQKTFYKVNYKGKHFIIKDKLDELDFEVGTITRTQALNKEFIKEHKGLCRYFGIPAYIGEDKDFKRIFRV